MTIHGQKKHIYSFLCIFTEISAFFFCLITSVLCDPPAPRRAVFLTKTWTPVRTEPGAGGQGVGAVWWLAAARLGQISGVLVAEVQAEATLMLGTASDKDRVSVSSLLVNYSARGKKEFFMPSVREIWGSNNSVSWHNQCTIYEVIVLEEKQKQTQYLCLLGL